jgi:hypothetical protein
LLVVVSMFAVLFHPTSEDLVRRALNRRLGAAALVRTTLTLADDVRRREAPSRALDRAHQGGQRLMPRPAPAV